MLLHQSDLHKNNPLSNPTDVLLIPFQKSQSHSLPEFWYTFSKSMKIYFYICASNIIMAHFSSLTKVLRMSPSSPVNFVCHEAQIAHPFQLLTPLISSKPRFFRPFILLTQYSCITILHVHCFTLPPFLTLLCSFKTTYIFSRVFNQRFGLSLTRLLLLLPVALVLFTYLHPYNFQKCTNFCFAEESD